MDIGTPSVPICREWKWHDVPILANSFQMHQMVTRSVLSLPFFSPYLLNTHWTESKQNGLNDGQNKAVIEGVLYQSRFTWRSSVSKEQKEKANWRFPSVFGRHDRKCWWEGINKTLVLFGGPCVWCVLSCASREASRTQRLPALETGHLATSPNSSFGMNRKFPVGRIWVSNQNKKFIILFDID